MVNEFLMSRVLICVIIFMKFEHSNNSKMISLVFYYFLFTQFQRIMLRIAITEKRTQLIMAIKISVSTLQYATFMKFAPVAPILNLMHQSLLYGMES